MALSSESKASITRAGYVGNTARAKNVAHTRYAWPEKGIAHTRRQMRLA
jgi:hypothetical protein